MEFLGKQNIDGSYSVSVKARELVEVAWVDFYLESAGRGYQRLETMRETRAREIEDYFKRCFSESVKPRLFEMTASARYEDVGDGVPVEFDPLDENKTLGFVKVSAESNPWMSMVDGGTRLRGIQRAVESGTLSGEEAFDVRLFCALSVPEEIALFLLINENQKRVRTDLSLRVVQRYLDEQDLTDSEMRTLKTVVPDTEQWRYEASRIAARLNSDTGSPFRDLIQMPGEKPTGKSVAMQAFWTSLKHILDDDDLSSRLRRLETERAILSQTEFWVKVLKNFWGAVGDVNPDARAEPRTNVLWGSIGVNGCHRALASIVRSELSTEQLDLTRERFMTMVKDSHIADFSYWFTRKGGRRDEYPAEKGEATQMTGNSGYIRLSGALEEQWRANLHAAGSRPIVNL